MAERRLHGLAAAPGVAAGAVWRVGPTASGAHSGDAAADLGAHRERVLAYRARYGAS